MAKATLRLDMAGVRQVLRSPETAAVLRSKAEQGASRANSMAPKGHGYTSAPPYGAYVDVGEYTAIGKVAANTEMARRDNAKNGTLRKCLGGGS